MASVARIEFRAVVENIFNRWTALKLAVEHGMGGRNGVQTAIQMIDDITDFCITHRNIRDDEVQDALDELMDQHFNTICDDESTKEIGFNLVRYLRMLQDGQGQKIKEELDFLPTCPFWIQTGHRLVRAPSTSSSDEEGEDMETETSPSTSGATHPPAQEQAAEVEEGEPGWTVVRGRKRN